MAFDPIDFLLHLDAHLASLVAHYGGWVYALVFLIIFCETGLVVTPFLPGDSLLFIGGALAAAGDLQPLLLFACLATAALLGDSCNYLIGRTLGSRLFANPESRVFRRDYLQRTQAFYARHGGKTVTLARFMPILRTFAPFVAGLGRMHYPSFLAYSLLGTLLWIGGLLSLGYRFGNVAFIRQHLTLMILLVIGLSLLPMLIGWLRHRRAQGGRLH